jgi:hypothetical protein
VFALFCRLILPVTFLATLVSAVPITTLVSTGQAPQGSQDPYWQYRASPFSPFVPAYVTAPNSNGFPFYAWMGNSATSRWISPNPVYGTDSGVWGDGFNYIHLFRLIFALPANADPSTATFSYRFAVDDRLHSIWFNGQMILNDPTWAYSYNQFSPVFTVGPGSFWPGNNYLEIFILNNQVTANPNPMSWNPVALRFEIVSSNVELLPPPPPPPGGGVIPEPAPLLLTAAGLMALGLLRIRRN